MNMECKDAPCCSSPRVPFIPLPMAVVMAMMAFLFGAVVGTLASNKRAMMMRGGYGGPMMHGGMRGHHHHGDGAPACREWHGGGPPSESPPMEP